MAVPGYETHLRKYNALKQTPSTTPEIKASHPILQRQIDEVKNTIVSGPPNGALTYTGDLTNVNFMSAVEKAVLPDYLWRPAYGRPRMVNVPEIRRLQDTPTPAMCINTIITEITSTPWEIQMRDEDATPNDAAIDEVTEKLQNPNRNKEDIKMLLRQMLRDVYGLDSGVIVKTYDLASFENADPTQKLLPLGRRNMLEFKAYDGGQFVKNPSIYGVLPDQQAYYQYSFSHTQSRGIPFGRDEVVWFECNPRTNQYYGISPMETLFDVIRYEVFGVRSGIDYYTRNKVPRGVISIIDGNTDHIKRFKEQLADRSMIKDPRNDEMRWVSSTTPIINADTKFTSFELTPDTMRTLETQQWYIKLVFAVFGVTPSELGFTDDSNRATDVVQSEVFRRKAILPMLDLIEFYFNREIIPEYGFEDVMFKFIRTDISQDLREQELWSGYLTNGQRTVNEWRKEKKLEPVSWGDEPYSGSSFGLDSQFGDMPLEEDAVGEDDE